MKSRLSNALLIAVSLCPITLSAAETLPKTPKSGAADETLKIAPVPILPSAPASDVAQLPPVVTPLAPSALPAAAEAPIVAVGASASFEASAPAWDYKALAEWRRLLASESIVSVAFSPDSKVIAGGGDGKVFLWNQQGDLLSTLVTEPPAPVVPEPIVDPKDDLLGQKKAPPKLLPPKNLVEILVFSPDGKILATSSGSTVKLWNAESGAWLRTLAGHGDAVTSLVFTPDSRAIATGSMDKTIKIWASAPGQLLGTLSQHVYPVRAVAFSSDVKTLFSIGAQGRGRKNGELKVWNVAGKGELLQENTLDSVAPATVQLEAQGRILAAGSDSAFPSVKLWDPQTAQFVRTTVPAYNTGILVTSMSFTPDFALVAGGGTKTKKSSQVWLWEVKSGKMLKQIQTAPQNALAFSPDGRVLAVAGEDKAVQLWRVP